MARLKVLSWNVENSKIGSTDVSRVIRHVKDYDPDVFALLEVVGAGVFDRIASRFPDYSFHMTYGRQAQEILVGVRNTLPAFFSQKTEFKSGNREPRPIDVKQEATSNTEARTESQEVVSSAQIEPYVQADEAVRVRSGPGTEYERIGQLYPGEIAPVLGQNADRSWWQIEFAGADDGLGWVSADFVTFVGNPDSVPVVGDQLPTPTSGQSSTPALATVTPIPTSTGSPSPTGTLEPTQTPAPTRTSVPLQTPAPTQPPTRTRQPASMTPTPIPFTPTSTAIPEPTFTAAPVVSPTATPTATSTPMVRVTPVAQRRPVGLLWIGGAALLVAVGLGAVIFRTTRASRRR